MREIYIGALALGVIGSLALVFGWKPPSEATATVAFAALVLASSARLRQ